MKNEKIKSHFVYIVRYKISYMIRIRLILFSLFITQLSTAQTWQDTLSLIEKTFAQYKSDLPGCQLSVSRNGKIIFSKAWGMADLERKSPLSTESVIEAGSVSKQFTAAAILLLEQQGKLSIDDDIRKYVPEVPDYGNRITLRHMLHHTSGLRDWGSVASLSGWPRGTRFYNNDDALEIIARQKHLNNKPGDEYIYSNSNYNLLAIIVLRVSGLSLAEFTRKYIFEPAGMTRTQWRDDPNRIVPHRAIAYSKSMISYEIDMPNEYVYGNGGLLTTTEDLVRWTEFYQKGKMGTSSMLSRQVQTDPFNNGVINTYAAGLNVRPVLGWSNISHGGATAGYRAYLETFPELNLTIAVLSNTSQFDIGSQAGRVRKIFVTDKSEKISKNAKGISLSDEQLNAFQGLYKNERDNNTFQLSVRNKEILMDNSSPVQVVSSNSLIADSYSLEINGNKGKLIRFSYGDTIAVTKVIPAHPSEKELLLFTGDYFSEETQSYITIKLVKNVLTISFKPVEEYPLIPNFADAFKILPLGTNVEFERSPEKGIHRLKMSNARARNVEFNKIK